MDKQTKRRTRTRIQRRSNPRRIQRRNNPRTRTRTRRNPRTRTRRNPRTRSRSRTRTRRNPRTRSRSRTRTRRNPRTRSRSKTRTTRTKSKYGDLPHIFVINLKRDEEKWNKYKDDPRYHRYSACNGIEMSEENPYYDKLQIMWNASKKKKQCTAGILNSHMSVIQEIVDKKIDKALVIEDDAVVDFKRLEKIKLDKLPQDSIIYFGGTFHSPKTFKDKYWTYGVLKEQLDEQKPGLMKIDTDRFRILGGHGYYFPKWELAKDLLDRMNQKEKMRALDTEMVQLQRQGIIKYFYYPALSYLNMEDAKKGVHSGYIHRDMKHYG